MKARAILYLKSIYFSFPFILGVFLCIQIVFKVGGMVSPADDFTFYFWPNAQNIQPTPHAFTTDFDHKEYTADGNLLRFGYTPPGYTYWLAAIISFGGNQETVFIINVLLLLAVLYFSKKLFELITPNITIIYTSLWGIVLNPLFVNIPKLFLSEGLFSLLTIIAIYCYLLAVKRSKTIYILLSVLFIFLSAETRSINIYLAFVLGIAILFSQIKWSTKYAYLFLFVTLGCTLLYLTPNDSSTYLRRTVSDGLSRFPDNSVAQKLHYSVRPKQPGWKASFGKELTAQLKEQPVALIHLYVKKFLKCWYATDSGEHETEILLFQLIHLISFLILGILLLIRKYWDFGLFLFLLMISYTCIVSTATLSICRYISPIVPFYIFCTVWLIVKWARPEHTRDSL